MCTSAASSPASSCICRPYWVVSAAGPSFTASAAAFAAASLVAFALLLAACTAAHTLQRLTHVLCMPAAQAMDI